MMVSRQPGGRRQQSAFASTQPAKVWGRVISDSSPELVMTCDEFAVPALERAPHGQFIKPTHDRLKPQRTLNNANARSRNAAVSAGR
jgi:hypothetical protein